MLDNAWSRAPEVFLHWVDARNFLATFPHRKIWTVQWRWHSRWNRPDGWWRRSQTPGDGARLAQQCRTFSIRSDAARRTWTSRPRWGCRASSAPSASCRTRSGSSGPCVSSSGTGRPLSRLWNVQDVSLTKTSEHWCVVLEEIDLDDKMTRFKMNASLEMKHCDRTLSWLATLDHSK